MNAVNSNIREAPSKTYVEEVRLTSRAAAGDRVAQQRLVRRLMPRVRRTMSYMTGDPTLAEDLTQLSLLRILKKAGSYRGDSQLEFWAIRVSTRMALNEIKKLSRRKSLNKHLPEPRSPFPGTEEAAIDSMMRQRLAKMLSKLPEKHRMVLILKHIEGYSVSEIAQIIEVPKNTVRERLRVARIKLRRAVEREPELKLLVLGREQ